ncbi:hypothetical protein [Liberiplasma polymorphum]|uniref:hypothetical protein n=1 Tax=Liberiplasma polymorphum TaxID=3374570 RepID=UPI0037736A70
MEHYYIDDRCIRFDSVNHAYFIDDKPILSISQIVRELYGNPYKRVDPEILKKAALKGNALKDMILDYETHDIKTFHVEMQGYIAIKRHHQFVMIESSPLVLLKHHGAIIAAGRFDMIVQSPFIDGLGLVGIRRMAHIHEEQLKLQLNLYKLAYEQTYKKRVSYIKCIHIRNRNHTYLDIAVDSSFVKEKLDLFVKTHPIDYTF